MDMTGYLYQASHGETFDSIARVIYEDEKYAAEMMCANPEHDGKSVFEGGEMLRIPDVDIPIEETGGVPEKAPWKE
jgi:hypothetical protein